LAVVADLVRAHHGRLDLDSTPGRGSTFTVTVPIVVTSRSTHATGGTTTESDRSLNGEARPSVLVVEDDTDLREFLTRLLTSDGWVVHAVADAETAVELTSGTSDVPDVVITDVVLPGQDGLALIEQLRARPATQRTPMLVLTARLGADATAEGLAAGADDYITKPFSSRELLARVRANHELHQQREKAIVTAQGREQQIRGALDSNRVIGTAVGIVMASYQLTAEQGFQLLVAASQNTNNKLRDIAARVVDTGALPFRPTMIDDLIIRVADTST
jgi:DNA-binding response OmpR family regulator